MARKINRKFHEITNFNSYLQTLNKLKKPSGYKFEQHILPPAPLTEQESNSLLAILCNTPGVIYNPRHRVESKSNGITPHRWEVLGFDSHDHHSEWITFNGLNRDTVDLLEEQENYSYE